MHVLLLTRYHDNDPGNCREVYGTYDLECNKAYNYQPRKIGLREKEIVEIAELTRDTDVECTSYKEEAWETLALLEEAGILVGMVELHING